MDLDYFNTISSTAAFEKAEAEGLVVVIPDNNTLQVDLDTEAQYKIFEKNIKILEMEFKLGFNIEPSKSGFPKRHATVFLPCSVTRWQRIALQAALGSDPVREMLSCIRVFNKDPHPTLFMEIKK